MVKCEVFDDCGGKVEGAGCIDCGRNLYSESKKANNYIPLKAEELTGIDNIQGICEFGEAIIHLDPEWKNVKVFLNGQLSRDILGLQIIAGPTMLTQVLLAIQKTKTQKPIDSSHTLIAPPQMCHACHGMGRSAIVNGDPCSICKGTGKV
jgi:hypothetical protein